MNWKTHLSKKLLSVTTGISLVLFLLPLSMEAVRQEADIKCSLRNFNWLY